MNELPKVGVGVIIRRNGKVLLHKRNSNHGYGTWAFPGGHLEMFETFEGAALREMQEEAGPDLVVTKPEIWTVANTRFYDEGKHYVVVFMISDWVSGEAKVMEPDKCLCWEWHSWEALPRPLMQGLLNLVDRNLNPFNISCMMQP